MKHVEFENDILIRCYEPHGEGALKAKLNELSGAAKQVVDN
ncbi:MAG: hypothetical protein ACC651_17995 [Candidatus Scalindua sp.]